MQKLNRLNELRLRVIREVENDVAGSSEVVLPAIFKQNVLWGKQILVLWPDLAAA